MAPFLAAIFLSAFLLFQIQPVIARYILPWYGGSPGVWTTALLFFQSGLLLGYAYAHLLVICLRERRRWQAGIHFGLLLLALLLLPIAPQEAWKPTGNEANPTLGIVWLLARSVGVPYLLLSASGPLLQHWFSESKPGHSPYRLYAVSNLGSLLGLLTYPFLFEPLFALHSQTMIWSWAFVVYVGLVLATVVVFLRSTRARVAENTEQSAVPPRWLDVLLWILFAACGSSLLLSITNQMCQDVAVIPFLWILPLALYLITFIVAFDHERWYLRPVAIPLAAISIGIAIWLMNRSNALSDWPLFWQIAVFSATVFFSSLVCHGEIVRIKPAPRYLTAFYLCISLGGALGGVFVSLIAPRIFLGFWELHVAFELLALLVTLQLWRYLRRKRRPRWILVGALAWAGMLFAMIYFLDQTRATAEDQAVARVRGFYGVLTVEKSGDGEDDYLALLNGRISHGRQYPAYPDLATTYYSSETGVGQAFENLPARVEEPPQPVHIGTVGLGTGTIAIYAKPGDRFRFYEINPQVEQLARKHFTYLDDCKGEAEVVLGDARTTLEKELREGGSQQFDALFVDAFSGDSIPVHLLTREAFALYFEHLKPDGVLAIHITNIHIDLADPVRNLAKDFGRRAFRVEYSPDFDDYHSYYSDWVLITPEGPFAEAIRHSLSLRSWDNPEPKAIRWTDDYSNIFQALR